MENYIVFEPSKEALYDNSFEDSMYLFNKDKVLVKIEGEGYKISSRGDIEELNLDIIHLQCLGAYEGKDCYSGEIGEVEDCNYEFIDLRTYSRNVKNHSEFLIAGKALLLLDHMRSNQRCGVCGAKMNMKPDGNDRAMMCTSCDNMVWPKTAPAVIVAVTNGDRLLLAHNKMFQDGVYSVLAGFVEMGETFEDCVKREVFEETGIKVHNIKYFGSQPWPFPNSMMIGFTAEYLDGEIKVDNDEIVDAKWFTKEEAQEKYRNSISISSRLVEWFLDK